MPAKARTRSAPALASYSLAGANVENLTATSDAAHDFRGNSGNNVITGGAGTDILRLYDGGDDTVLAGGGDDIIFIIGALTAADVITGGAGTDNLVLQGAYGALTLTANVTQIEGIAILGGNNTNFGEPGTNRYDYVITTHDFEFRGRGRGPDQRRGPARGRGFHLRRLGGDGRALRRLRRPGQGHDHRRPRQRHLLFPPRSASRPGTR